MGGPFSSAAASSGGWNGESVKAMAGRNPLRSDHGDAQWNFFEISSFRNRPSLHTIGIYDTVH
jgi:hypothetical protein